MKLDIPDYVFESTAYKFNKLLKVYDKFNLTKPKKNLSEDLSGLFENAFVEYYQDTEQCYAPKKDSEPDIILNGHPIEVKCTAGENWRGGHFSKRPGWYLLIAWDVVEPEYEFKDKIIKFFVAGLDMEIQDWEKGMVGNYYATSFTKKSLAEKDFREYKGNIKRYNRGKVNCLKVIKEEIKWNPNATFV